MLVAIALYTFYLLQWRHNEHDSVSNHQPHDYLLSRLFRRRSKKTSKLRATGLCVGNSPGTGEFPTQMPSNAEMFPFDEVIMCYIGSWYNVAGANGVSAGSSLGPHGLDITEPDWTALECTYRC